MRLHGEFTVDPHTFVGTHWNALATYATESDLVALYEPKCLAKSTKRVRGCLKPREEPQARVQ